MGALSRHLSQRGAPFRRAAARQKNDHLRKTDRCLPAQLPSTCEYTSAYSPDRVTRQRPAALTATSARSPEPWEAIEASPVIWRAGWLAALPPPSTQINTHMRASVAPDNAVDNIVLVKDQGMQPRQSWSQSDHREVVPIEPIGCRTITWP